MEQKSRRPGEGDGSNVLLGGERLEPTSNSFKTQFPIISRHWLRELETAAQP
jgi:hypothetical protein